MGRAITGGTALTRAGEATDARGGVCAAMGGGTATGGGVASAGGRDIFRVGTPTLAGTGGGVVAVGCAEMGGGNATATGGGAEGLRVSGGGGLAPRASSGAAAGDATAAREAELERGEGGGGRLPGGGGRAPALASAAGTVGSTGQEEPWESLREGGTRAGRRGGGPRPGGTAAGPLPPRMDGRSVMALARDELRECCERVGGARRGGGPGRDATDERRGGGVAVAPATAEESVGGRAGMAPNCSSAIVGGPPPGPPIPTVAERSLPRDIDGDDGVGTPARAPACVGIGADVTSAAAAGAPPAGGSFVLPLFSMMLCSSPMPCCVSVRMSSMFVLSAPPISEGAHTIAMLREFIMFLSLCLWSSRRTWTSHLKMDRRGSVR
mmetsp:Transcript_20069/g.76867  ORF Transcript_20069/g.76867 Transcript_20069/m.76867 type:complete len:381 (-) Transcript_20069:454-1596(-)